MMLQENLSRIRRERGLTQEALAIKLNVVRQTVSKWENGTAVPDADMLCRIADAMDASVAELLGSPEHKDETDMTAIAKSLAEINEQLAVSNRRSSRGWKAALSIAMGLLLSIALVMALNISADTSVTDNDVTARIVDPGEWSGTAIELDKRGVPLLRQADRKNEHAWRDFFRSRNISREQIIASWGNPAREKDQRASWLIGEDQVMTVFFADNQAAYDCGIESR